MGVKEVDILEPRGEVEAGAGLAHRVTDLKSKVLGLHSNHQPNADLFMDELEVLLSHHIDPVTIMRGEESELAGNCDALITGVGF